MQNYSGDLDYKERLCNSYMSLAEQAYEENGSKPCAEQCRYLQKAITLQQEMAQISIGEEQKYHQRQVAILNKQIREIIRVINPEIYQKLVAGTQARKEAANANANPKAAQKGKDGSNSNVISNETGVKKTSKGNSGPSDEEVQSWFKEAPKHSFEDVSGMADLKERLKECIADSKLGELKEYLNIPQMHSYFFIGPPGCGKTYAIEAFAHELMDKDYKYLSLVGSDILSQYVGKAEKIITRLFEEAEKNAPCIIFIDEVDGVCKNRSQPLLPEYAASLTTAFLTGYNRINHSDKPIIFIGATNYPNRVDNAMLDRVELVRVPFPDEEARKFAFERKFSKIIQLEDGFSYDDIAAVTDSYNYRDIDRLSVTLKNMILKDVMQVYQEEKKALQALREGQYCLNRTMFEQAQSKCLPTPKEDIIKELDEWERKFESMIRERG